MPTCLCPSQCSFLPFGRNGGTAFFLPKASHWQVRSWPFLASSRTFSSLTKPTNQNQATVFLTFKKPTSSTFSYTFGFYPICIPFQRQTSSKYLWHSLFLVPLSIIPQAIKVCYPSLSVHKTGLCKLPITFRPLNLKAIFLLTSSQPHRLSTVDFPWNI